MRIKNFTISVGSQFFKCLSEQPRLRILNTLSNGVSLTITDLELILEYSQAKTSRHISYLKNAGLIHYKRVDNYSFYSINEEWEDIISQSIHFVKKDTILTKDLNTLEILSSNRELSVNKVGSRKFHEKPV
jgi:ArsR family transcriptional regulator, arsenate/arsenite/antimonite-responsive transcriptional repressor